MAVYSRSDLIGVTYIHLSLTEWSIDLSITYSTRRLRGIFLQKNNSKIAGPGFWKFNSSLLENEEYINEFKANINNYRNKYLYLDDKGLRWDLIKVEVRGFTIAYAKRKAKKKRNEEKKLQQQLNELLAQSAQCKTNPLLRTKIQSTQMHLKQITDQKVKGAILRSKARWVESQAAQTLNTINMWH